MENTVELYHEFLTQMESTDYSNNQIQLEPIVRMDIEGKEGETEGDRGYHKHKHSDKHNHKHKDHKHSDKHKHKHKDHKHSDHKHSDHKHNINIKTSSINPPPSPPSPSSPSSPSIFPKPQMPLFSNPSHSCLSIDMPSSLAPSDSNEFVNMKDFEISLDLDQFDITLDDNVSVISYESDNPVVPGLFPKMNIDDDDQFLKFDALPLNPSYISK